MTALLVDAEGPGPIGPAAPPRRGTGRRRLILVRFLRNRGGVLGLAMLAALFLLAYAVPLLYPWDHTQLDFTAFQQPPSARHWFGTDAAGADIFAATMRGMQKSLVIGLLAGACCTVVATVVGVCAGYFEGWPDRVLTTVVSLLLVMPSFLLIAVVSPLIKGSSWLLFAVLLAAFSWMITGRVVRNMTRSLKDREFVRAAVYLGVSRRLIIIRHIVPAMASLLIVDGTLQVGATIIGEAGLSYFGFGVQPPDVSLGGVIASGAPAAPAFPWLFYFPAGCLVLICLSVFLIGDGLRDALDPGARGAKARLPHTASDRPSAPGRRPVAPPTPGAALEVTDLHVSFPGETGTIRAVRGLSYTVRPGEVLGIVGESGAGKSASATAVLGLLPDWAEVSGSVRLHGKELLGLGDSALSAVRGNDIGMVFQDPLSALTPVYSIGFQIAEALRVHQPLDRAAARRRAIELLDLVGIPDPGRMVDAYPHQCSGGMCQRVVIAMAIANRPKVLIADEPTTALDVTVQAQILDVLRTAGRATGAAIVLITHDLGVVAGIADRVQVMYAGRTVETGPVDEVYEQPRMPYTIGLLGAVPRPDRGARQVLTPVEGSPPSMVGAPVGCPFSARCPIVVDECRGTEPALRMVGTMTHPTACHRSHEFGDRGLDPRTIYPVPPVPEATALESRPRLERDKVLELNGLVRHFPLMRGLVPRRQVGTVRAVDGVSLDIRQEETLALVGESGCGKSTTLLEIVDLTRSSGSRRGAAVGDVSVFGRDVHRLDRAGRRALRRDLQIVFQDPTASLDARLPVGDILAEPLKAHGWPRDRIAPRVTELFELVGLDSGHADRFPSELSGGERQRINIARSLALEPRLILLDEPVSALDVSVQASVLNLLAGLKRKLGLSYLLVAHDLSVARQVADRVAVMYLGRIVELGDTESVFTSPSHPYTQVLLSAVPLPDPRKERTRRHIGLTGEAPSAADIPTGCRFRSLCPRYLILTDAEQRPCEDEDPGLQRLGTDHTAACHYAARPVRDEPAR